MELSWGLCEGMPVGVVTCCLVIVSGPASTSIGVVGLVDLLLLSLLVMGLESSELRRESGTFFSILDSAPSAILKILGKFSTRVRVLWLIKFGEVVVYEKGGVVR
jgi:hypothetical protein